MLVHVVLFDFKPDVATQKRQSILDLARVKLAAIPGVMNLLVGKAATDKCDYPFALSMYFDDLQALETYRAHPDHVHFRDVEFFPYLQRKQGMDYND